VKRNRKQLISQKVPRMAGYTRVSTPMQVERGESLDVQERRLREESDRRGWELVIYREPGISGKDENRPVYQQMRADLAAGRLDGVAATKLDRLWRHIRLAVNEVYFITQTCSGNLITLDQKFDTTTAVGRAMLNILFTFGQFEREMTGERVGEAMRVRAQQGKFNGGPIPYGYRRAERGKLVVEESEAETVRQILNLFLEKETVRGVCHALNAAGKRTRKGQAWANQTIRRILSSPIYVGVLVYNKRDTSTGKAKPRPDNELIHAENAVPCIISQETFTAAQALLKARSVLAPRAQASDYLLAGLVKCERCEGNMTGYATWGRGRKARHRYYRCASHMQKGPTVCRGSSVRADDLEEVVLDSLLGLRINPDKLRALQEAQQTRERDEIAPFKKKLGRLERTLRDLVAREERIMLAFEQGAYSAADLARRRSALSAERAKIKVELEETKSLLDESRVETFNIEYMVRVLDTALHLYYRISFEEQRRLLHALIGEVVVGNAEGHYTLKALEEWEGLLEGEAGQRFFVVYPLSSNVVIEPDRTGRLTFKDLGLEGELLQEEVPGQLIAKECWAQMLERRGWRASVRNQMLARADI